MTSLVIGIVLIVGGIAFAAYPLLRRPAREDADGIPDTGAGRTRPAPVAAPPNPVAAELEELELDRAMGKLAESDYQHIRTALESRGRARAPKSAVIAQAPATPVPATPMPSAPDATERVNTDVQAVSDLDAEAERLVSAERAHVVSCGTCGPRPEPGARFCSHCGRAIGDCPACGKPIRQPGARYCDQCGTALVA